MRRFILCFAVLLPACQGGLAHEIASADLTVVHPFVKVTPPHAQVGGGYMIIENAGVQEDRLISVESPDAAEHVEMHRSVVSDGIATMQPIEDGIVVPANGSVTIGSDGTHLMFVGLTAPFGLGQLIDATLVFEHAGRVPITFEVEPLSTPTDDPHHDH